MNYNETGKEAILVCWGLPFGADIGRRARSEGLCPKGYFPNGDPDTIAKALKLCKSRGSLILVVAYANTHPEVEVAGMEVVFLKMR